MTLYRVVAVAVAICCIAAGAAHAYLDPGTGSYVLQLVIATLLGAAFAVKMFWLRIRNFFSNLLSRKSKGE
jgi:hypothetical protein